MPSQHTTISTAENISVPAGLIPGVLLCLLVSGSAYEIEHLERLVFGKAWVEALNLAIVIGTLTPSFFTADERTIKGVQFCSKPLLECSILLLGASISAKTLWTASPYILASIVALVVGTISSGLIIGRLFGLSFQRSALIACGNAICGNSAIIAVAPVVKAKETDITACITITALLGTALVVALPLLAPILGLSAPAYGTLSGLTVYAVPQVVAATNPVGIMAIQTGMFVKLGRVLLLGPVCLVLALLMPRQTEAEKLPLQRLVPWYIPGFFILMLCRSVGAIPEQALIILQQSATFLTVLAMAALGLRVNPRSLMQNNLRLLTVSALSVSTVFIGALLLTRWLYAN
ncbi:hypothetical protein AA106555_1570 [Neokomagataea thailandica NBRC 106555]|uniref:Uncharacterized protein n=2 Tax=Neokomagataea TaxID=1223423 RepID=A0ABQ0QRE2_9PROT|nr:MULTISPECIES: putative sulfate exporter family transporter [Neokomagataea]QDH25073.1 putative sulfate exporter family transporter [Neokomagataea tanensis]GBR54149.1 hypothetical protein AA106555_1570 [Neokomagataea thailandica NBRC 106555]